MSRIGVRNVSVMVSMAFVLLAAGPASAAARKRIPAFPGAQGFGAHTPGGRGGRIIEVTNLKPNGPGSLQAACRAKGPRIVVFRVSGLIPGTSAITEPYITIAGQTAPGDGVCIHRGPIRIMAHDVVIRYLRSRPGDHPDGARGDSRDCLSMYHVPAYRYPVRNVVIDHCSFSWGIDENVQVYGSARDVTIQWCIVSEPLNDSIHPKGPHGCGMILGCRNTRVTAHHCLLAHNRSRTPLVQSKRWKIPSTFDIRNNLVYKNGVGTVFAQIQGNMFLNYVGNVQRDAPATVQWGITSNRYASFGPSRIYVKDNIWPGLAKSGGDPWRILSGSRGVERLAAAAAAPPVTTGPAKGASEDVLKFAGSTLPVRDVVDARIVEEVRNGAGHVIDSQADVGGWPTYASAAPPADADHDAMPDAWEKRFGFSPNDPTDGPKDLDGDGYTNVEEFLNRTDPTKPDTGAPITQVVPTVQSGNDRIRGAAARRIGERRLAKLNIVNATKESEAALIADVRKSGKEVADFLGIRFAKVPAGELTIAKRKAKVSAFELSVCEITQKQWQAVMGTRPWAGKPGVLEAHGALDAPATYVNVADCEEFIRRLNACPPARGAQTGGKRKYRLPTRCEWAWAAASGANSPYGFGKSAKRAAEYARCFPHRKPSPVGSLKPNAYGLYDMAGNVSEWLYDKQPYWDREFAKSDRLDFMGPKTGFYRMTGGGAFRYSASEILRCLFSRHFPRYRGWGVGFRLRRNAE